MDEFSLIHHYFSLPSRAIVANKRFGVSLGIGDDCALISKRDSNDLALSVDTLIEAVHFPADAPPDRVAQRALAVSVSDLAAMGADPRCFTLALTLTNAQADWLDAFGRGLHAAATQYHCALVGGDTTRGKCLTLSVQVMGDVPVGAALRRSGARPGDGIYVTGALGDGAAALACLEERLVLPDPSMQEYLLQRFYAPQPQIQAGLALRNLASSAIDISDGLLADLGHICKASGVAARLYLEKLPLTNPLLDLVSPSQLCQWALTGGDDYHLCFTVPPENKGALEAKVAQKQLDAHLIGEILPAGEQAIIVEGADGLNLDLAGGYRHFA